MASHDEDYRWLDNGWEYMEAHPNPTDEWFAAWERRLREYMETCRLTRCWEGK